MALAAPFPAARRSASAARTAARPSTRTSPRAADRTADRTADRAPRRAPGRVGSPVRLTARGRAVLMLASVAFLLVAVLFSGQLTADAGSTPAARSATTEVVVQQGENLWQIARRLAPQADPRDMVTRIRQINGLGNEAVVPGQAIAVPVAG